TYPAAAWLPALPVMRPSRSSLARYFTSSHQRCPSALSSFVAATANAPNRIITAAAEIIGRYAIRLIRLLIRGIASRVPLECTYPSPPRDPPRAPAAPLPHESRLPASIPLSRQSQSRSRPPPAQIPNAGKYPRCPLFRVCLPDAPPRAPPALPLRLDSQ